jgi:hypothetical protein
MSRRHQQTACLRYRWGWFATARLLARARAGSAGIPSVGGTFRALTPVAQPCDTPNQSTGSPPQHRTQSRPGKAASSTGRRSSGPIRRDSRPVGPSGVALADVFWTVTTQEFARLADPLGRSKHFQFCVGAIKNTSFRSDILRRSCLHARYVQHRPSRTWPSMPAL